MAIYLLWIVLLVSYTNSTHWESLSFNTYGENASEMPRGGFRVLQSVYVPENNGIAAHNEVHDELPNLISPLAGEDYNAMSLARLHTLDGAERERMENRKMSLAAKLF